MKPLRTNETSAFTLIELLVVLAIVAVLLTIAVPRYFSSVDRAKETVLVENLRTTRDAIDKFFSDTGRYPNALDELVQRSYLRTVPHDPVTDSADTWVLSPPRPHTKGGCATCTAAPKATHRMAGPMAAFDRQRGFTYLGLLILIAVLSVATLATLEVGQLASRRQAEDELLFIGHEFEQALRSYMDSTPAGQRPYPASLQDLLKDNRHPGCSATCAASTRTHSPGRPTGASCKRHRAAFWQSTAWPWANRSKSRISRRHSPNLPAHSVIVTGCSPESSACREGNSEYEGLINTCPASRTIPSMARHSGIAAGHAGHPARTRRLGSKTKET